MTQEQITTMGDDIVAMVKAEAGRLEKLGHRGDAAILLAIRQLASKSREVRLVETFPAALEESGYDSF